MRIRHRTPSIFNLSMVDVLCCALGCVILPLLYYLYIAQEYKDETERQNRQSAAMLASVTEDRDGAYQMLLELQGQLDTTAQDKSTLDQELKKQKARVLLLETQLTDASRRQALTSKDLESLRDLLDQERKLAGNLEKDKTTLKERLATLQALVDRLPTLERELADTRDREKQVGVLLRTRDAELAASRGKEKELGAMLGLRETDLAAARTQEKQMGDLLRAREVDLVDLSRRVQLLTTDKAQLEKNLATLTSDKMVLEKTLNTHATNLNTTQTRTRQLEKELATTLQTLLNLQEEKKALEAKAARAKAASDARFAGIELSGRRVVFLVDTSLSMIETADGKPFPEKWAGVIDTVIKVMQSLPELEAYQLVLFSREAQYPLGQPGEWLRYDPSSSPDLVRRTLQDPKYKPDGGTNMYAGLESAFKLRQGHLDTIYLFSDGLPSRGAGVDPLIQKTLSDTELARRLGDHVRQTLRTEWNQPIQNLPQVRIHSIGFFYASPDVGAFLWSLSRENNGSFVGMSRP